MGENHLTYFKIENFKRFESFEMENLGQFNLLVGDNNVGKTSVLEGLCFEEDRIQCLSNLISILYHRNISEEVSEKVLSQINAWKYIIKDLHKPLKIYVRGLKFSSITIEFLKENELEESDKKFINASIKPNLYPELWIRYLVDNINLGTFGRYAQEIISFDNSNSSSIKRFLGLNVMYNSGHTERYFSLINSNNESRLLFDSILKSIIPNLLETRPHKIFNEDILGIVLKNTPEIMPITVFGDGVLKLVRILLGIIDAKGKRLMIDEIETGIHFSRLKEFWKTVITLCKKYDVQLFATTHSLECQKYFVEALAELGEDFQNDARNISLVENMNGDVKSVTFDFNQFEFAMEIGYNTRGGI